MQHVEQRRTVDAEPAPQPPQRRIAHIEHHPPALGIGAPQPIEWLPQRRDLGVKPEIIEDRQPGRLQDQPRPDRLRLLEPLEQRHPVPEPVEVKRRREPGRPGSRDRNGECWSQGRQSGTARGARKHKSADPPPGM